MGQVRTLHPSSGSFLLLVLTQPAHHGGHNFLFVHLLPHHTKNADLPLRLHKFKSTEHWQCAWRAAEAEVSGALCAVLLGRGVPGTPGCSAQRRSTVPFPAGASLPSTWGKSETRRPKYHLSIFTLYLQSIIKTLSSPNLTNASS